MDSPTTRRLGAQHHVLGPASIATVGYSDLHYETVELQAHVSDFAREALMLEVLLRLSDGRVCAMSAQLSEGWLNGGIVSAFLFSYLQSLRQSSNPAP